jgi:hypothetical protein
MPIHRVIIFGTNLSRPIKAVWTWPEIEDARCLQNNISLLAQASMNTISEFLVACFPIPIIFSLNMRRSQRFAVAGLLCLGFLVVICGSLRTYYLWLVYQDYDLTWWAIPHWIASEVEIDTSMVGGQVVRNTWSILTLI